MNAKTKDYLKYFLIMSSGFGLAIAIYDVTQGEEADVVRIVISALIFGTLMSIFYMRRRQKQ